MKFKKSGNPAKSMEIGTYSGQLYYVVDEEIYINLPENWEPQENGVEIHSRRDVNLFFGPHESMKEGSIFLDYDKLNFPIKDIVAYSTQSFHKHEIINS